VHPEVKEPARTFLKEKRRGPLFKRILFIMMVILPPLMADEPGYQARLFAGYNTVSFNLHPQGKMKVRAGQVIGAGFGYRVGNGFVTEVETSFRYNETDKITLKGKRQQFLIPLHGDIKSFSLFGNVIYELPFNSSLKPYFGVGLGATAEYSNWSAHLIEDSVWFDMEGGQQFAFSYQLIGGIRLPAMAGYYCGLEFRMFDSVLDHMCNHNRSLIFSYHKLF
jgi:opacity protein-like surface antigen